jgi:hypothetical protein
MATLPSGKRVTVEKQKQKQTAGSDVRVWLLSWFVVVVFHVGFALALARFEGVRQAAGSGAVSP